MPCGKKLTQDDLPTKLKIGDDWLLKKKQDFETATEPGGTLMGRLASRMASRSMIDELNLGPKGRTSKQKEAVIADNSVPSKLLIGAGLHEQVNDLVASNFSNPIPEGKKAAGSNMADQAKASGNVFETRVKL